MTYRTTLRVVALVSACFFLGCDAGEPDLNFRCMGASDATDSRLWLICRAESGGQLAFAVFEGGPRSEEGLKSAVTATHNANNDRRTTVEVTRPDGTILRLPGDVKLVEIIDGQYKESKEQVSLQDFDAFVASKPEAYTIDNLLKFAATRRGRK